MYVVVKIQLWQMKVRFINPRGFFVQHRKEPLVLSIGIELLHKNRLLDALEPYSFSYMINLFHAVPRGIYDIIYGNEKPQRTLWRPHNMSVDTTTTQTSATTRQRRDFFVPQALSRSPVSCYAVGKALRNVCCCICILGKFVISNILEELIKCHLMSRLLLVKSVYQNTNC